MTEGSAPSRTDTEPPIEKPSMSVRRGARDAIGSAAVLHAEVEAPPRLDPVAHLAEAKRRGSAARAARRATRRSSSTCPATSARPPPFTQTTASGPEPVTRSSAPLSTTLISPTGAIIASCGQASRQYTRAPMPKATETITWLNVPAEEDVPAEARELWDKPLEKLGFVPNVLRVMALRPRASRQAGGRTCDELMTRRIGADEDAAGDDRRRRLGRRTVATTASSRTRLRCASSPATRVLADQIATNYRYAPLEPGERAMLDYALKLTADSVLVHGGRRRRATRSGLERRGHPRHRTGRGDVQLHEPACQRTRLGPKPRVLLSRSLIA